MTRLVVKNLKIGNKPKVIYTAHGLHFYKGASLKNWFMFYPIEKYLSKDTDVLITINKEDFETANTKFKAMQIKPINGVGINLYKFKAVNQNKKMSLEKN